MEALLLLAVAVAVTVAISLYRATAHRPPAGRHRRGGPPLACATRTGPFTGVARAIDGDSLEVRADDDHTIIEVRLQDVDAPEFDQPEGPIAAAKLRRILRTGECTVEPRGLDRYGRLVAKVRRADGKDIGLCMIAAGYAVAVAERPRVYVACERQARAEGRGAWGHGGFVHPSEWRRAQAG